MRATCHRYDSSRYPPQAKISMQYLGVHNSERRSIEYSTFSRPTRSGNDAKYKDFS